MEWKQFVDGERDKEYFKELAYRINNDRKKHRVFPPKEEIFNALKLTDFNNYTKFSTKKEIIDSNTYSNNFYVYFGSKYVGFNFGYLLALNNYGNVYKQQIRIKVKKDITLFI